MTCFETLSYTYDSKGRILKEKNSDGSSVSYEYDAWGAVILSDSDIANINPIRYRGYYLDSETGYYYLQSRYYDPDICRFINADLPEVSTITKSEYSGLNSFSYCNNNPLNITDKNGQLSIAVKLTIGAALGALIGGISEIIIQRLFEHRSNNNLDWRAVAIEAVSGAVNGALLTVGMSPKYRTIIKGITTAVTSLARNINSGNFSTPRKAIMSIGSAILSTVVTMYTTSVSSNINRITGRIVAPQTIKAITKQVSISRLRAAGIRAIIRIGKYQYNLRFD